MGDPLSLIIGLIVSSIGVGYCIYGRKQRHMIAFLAGLFLIGLPYLFDNNLFLIVISIVIMFLPKFIKL